MAKILYLSYDGMTDALGESQVLSYIVGLSKNGHDITLISFEKKRAYQQKKERINHICSNEKINWIPLKYTSKPPILSTIYDIQKLKNTIRKINFRVFDIVHCRGYITSLIGLQLKQKHKIPFIFDMRGFWADEKVDSGHWDTLFHKPVYRFFKNKEKEFCRYSDIIVSLTSTGKNELIKLYNLNKDKIRTIPTCVNLNIFKPFNEEIRNDTRAELNIASGTKVLVYSGSLGGNYSIPILLETFKVFYETYKHAKLIILTKTIEQDFPAIEDYLMQSIIIKSVPYHEVHKYLIASDMGYIFYKDGYSNIGRYPTKLAEYWACGLPCLVYKKIGDTKLLLDKNPSFGIYYNNEYELKNSLNSFDFNYNMEQMRNVTEELFSLEKGVKFYDSVYFDVLQKD